MKTSHKIHPDQRGYFWLKGITKQGYLTVNFQKTSAPPIEARQIH